MKSLPHQQSPEREKNSTLRSKPTPQPSTIPTISSPAAHLGSLPHLQRQAALLDMQRQFGNAATTRYIQRMMADRQSDSGGLFIFMPRGTIRQVQRQDDPDDDPYADLDAESEEPRTLSNSRFAGNQTLTQILNGEIEVLSRRHNGRTVRAVQRALFDMGYPLPEYLVDGSLGDETGEAIRRFREDHGLPPGTQFDGAAMEALDRVAPATGATANRSIDYARMFQDNRLTITYAIGYDEGGSHDLEVEDLTNFLEGLGFAGSSQEGGITIFTKMHTFSYEDPQQGQSVEREIEIRVRMISPSTEHARESFAQGLSEDDITLYSGHARYGTGPDFDEKDDPAENFVIGVGSALHESGVLETPPGEDASWYRGHRHMEHVLDQRRNDLEQMTQEGRFDPEQYRVWFFNACSTIHYLDELRNPDLAGGLDRHNLDIIGTRSSIGVMPAIEAAKSFIRSVLSMHSLDEMMGGMQGEVDQFRGEDPEQFFTEGFGDNPTFVSQPGEE